MRTEEQEEQWKRVLARDAGANFVYAVVSTGIFCRPNCPSRRPARELARFYPSTAEARAAGFRACLRCAPEGRSTAGDAAALAAAYLERHLDRQVSLAELARETGCSAGAVQRGFTRVIGVSPRVYANALRAERFRKALESPGCRVTDAVYAAGFSAPSRAQHAAPLGMAAKVYRARGRGERIGFVVGSSKLGLVLVAATRRGVCAVLPGEDAEALAAELRGRFPAAVVEQDHALQPWLETVLGTLSEAPEARELPLDLRGTAFQARVWAALRAIPRGQTRSYRQVAEAVGNPKAARAVARACADNPAALVVPCHRVIGGNGKLTGYRWGIERKRLLLEMEREPDLSLRSR